MYCIVGLGNPGAKYEFTRHNAGFLALDYLADDIGISVNKNHLFGQIGSGIYNGEKLILVKPQTFMNESGVCVRAVVDYYGIPLDKLIVIYDDIDLELGSLRVRAKGSAGGHNGMKSIVSHLGKSDFARVRIGIGKPEHGLVDHVLHAFSDEELKELPIEQAAKAALLVVKNGVEAAQAKYN